MTDRQEREGREERVERHETRRGAGEQSRVTLVEMHGAALQAGGLEGFEPHMIPGAWVYAKLGETATRDEVVEALRAFAAREV